MRVYVVRTHRGFAAKARDDEGYLMGYCCPAGHESWFGANEHAERLVREYISLPKYLAVVPKVYEELKAL